MVVKGRGEVGVVEFRGIRLKRSATKGAASANLFCVGEFERWLSARSSVPYPCDRPVVIEGINCVPVSKAAQMFCDAWPRI
jgi:hypothetical protein